MTPLNVLVLAVGGNVSQGILKALRHDPRPMRVIGADISPLQMGLYTVDCACISPWAHEAAFLPWLLETCQRESVSVILSGAEPVLMALAQHQAEIEASTGAYCICSPLRVMEIGDDKLKTCQWLKSSGLSCPAYADASDDNAVDNLLENTGFPLISKPRRGGGARGVFLVENQADLDYARSKEDYLLQESLGTQEEEYTVGCFCDRNGNLAPSCCMKREILAGTTYRAVLGDFTEVRAEAEAIVRRLQPAGPCNVQLRMTKRGPVCFEINPRFSGTTPIRTHFGYREVSAALDHFVEGKPVTLPLVTEGIALRYWNELYIDPEALAEIEEDGLLKKPSDYPSYIEAYGLEP
ncbi:MAG: ATP-grasp domain-containing protein [Candidatus Hydrogenedentes bacterium]|nr:ATP-grasp domain-containing protein [Candidatus Hydrogenedentota bacterium]